jgi:formamidopyrimidine-DNA glycosylase
VPELPDIAIYVEALDKRLLDQTIERVRLASPFVLRMAVPPISTVDGKRVIGLRRIGKRVVLALEGELFLALHLMVAGRLRWLASNAKPTGHSRGCSTRAGRETSTSWSNSGAPSRTLRDLRPGHPRSHAGA